MNEGGWQRLCAYIESTISEGVYGMGAQVAVTTGKATLAYSAGESFPGTAMTDETPYNLYCASIPIWAAALAEALCDAGLDGGELTVSELVPELNIDPSVRPGELLNHSTAISGTSALERRIRGSAGSSVQLAHVASRSPGQQVGFSDYIVPYLTIRMIERLTGDPYGYLNSVLTERLGVDGIHIPHDDAQVTSRLALSAGVYFFDLPTAPCPLMLDRSPRQIQEAAETSCFASATSYASFLSIYAGAIVGRNAFSNRWAWLASSARDRLFDTALKRMCAFRGALMARLEDHYFGAACSHESVGIAGLVGASFGFHDPLRELTLFATLNGLSENEEDMMHVRSSITRLAVECADVATY